CDVRTRAGSGDGGARNWFDRQVGYPRWAWLVSQKRGAVVPPRPLPARAPRAEPTVAGELTRLRRGHVRFTGLTIARPDPLGLVHALKTIRLPQSLLVLPRRHPMAPLHLCGNRKSHTGGARRD